MIDDLRPRTSGMASGFQLESFCRSRYRSGYQSSPRSRRHGEVSQCAFDFRNGWVVLALAAALAAPAQADTVADFYKGKTVTLIAGYSAGGGFDLYSRVIANYLGKHIPGQPRLVVQNMPGAGSLRAASHVYNVAPKDGTVISLTRAPVIAPLLGSQGGAGFDVTKFTWLGSGASDLTVCALLGNPKINTMADTLQHEFTLGGLGPGSDEDMYTKILRKLLGVKAQAASRAIRAARRWCWRSSAASSTAAAAGRGRASRSRGRNGSRARRSRC